MEIDLDRATKKHQNSHYIALDFLRGVAATCVVVLHYDMWTGARTLPSAGLAVDFFLMLSGFVMGFAYERRLNNSLMFARFALSRVIRLLPMIMFGAFLGYFAAFFGAIPGHIPASGARLALFGIFSAALIPVPPFMSPDPYPLNLSEWSLLFEFFANLIYASILYRMSTQRLFVLTSMTAIIYAYIARKSGMDGGYTWGNFHLGWLRVMLPTLIGLLIWRIHKAGSVPRLTLPLPVLGLVLLLTLAFPTIAHSWMIWILSIGLIFPALIVLSLSAKIPEQFLTIARLSGTLSYPIYIVHVPLLIFGISIAPRIGITFYARGLFLSTIIVGTAFFAELCYDRPIRQWLALTLIGPGKRATSTEVSTNQRSVTKGVE